MVLSIAVLESTLVKPSTSGSVDLGLLQSMTSKGGETGEVAREILSVHSELTTLNRSLREFIAELDRRA